MKTQEKDIRKRITDLKSIFKELNLAPKKFVLPYKKCNLPEEKSQNAMHLAFAIAEAYNEGWVPDWKNFNQYKWLPYYTWSDGAWVARASSWYNGRFCPSGLYFKSRELCEDAINKFPEVYKDFFMITDTEESDRA